MRKSNYNDQRDQQRQTTKKVMDMIIQKCSVCDIPSNKRRLFRVAAGRMCQSCMGEGTTLAMAVDAEAAYLAYLDAEAKKPPPEEFGEWS